MVSDWLSPINKLKWAYAFKHKHTEVTLDDGRKFSIVYLKGNMARVNPHRGQLPTGTFDTTKGQRWIEEVERGRRRV